MKRIAIIRISGQIGLKKDIKETFKLLNLHKKNTCVIKRNSATLVGMLKKIQECVTWGELDEKTFFELLEKRGKLPGNKKITKEYLEKNKINLQDFTKSFMEGKKELQDFPGLKKFFRLTPPIKGYGYKGVKKQFSIGGALGYRKEKINDLIHRMI